MKRRQPEKRILVIKHGALGDIVQALDGFSSLRAGFANAHLAVLTSPPFVSFMELMPWFNEVIGDPRAGVFNFRETLRIRSIIRRPWDLIIDMQGSNRTSFYHSFFSAGESKWVGRQPQCSHPLPDFGEINNTDRMLAIACIAGGIDTKQNVDWLAQPLGQDLQSSVGQHYAVFVPGCSPSRRGKLWPVEKYAKIAQEISCQGTRVVVVGTASDKPIIDAFKKKAPFVVDLCGRTSLGQLTSILQKSTFVVGNDTGPMFLAAKCGVPTLVLMGPETNPKTMAPRGPSTAWLRGVPIDQISEQEVLEALDQF
jgi:ADP-heptose:LPS heptosyltransferase